jgi:hypothetical protein
MVTLDESVRNLDQLCTQIAGAASRLQAHQASLESLDEALRGFTGTIGDALEDLDDGLESALDDLDRAADDACGEAEELGQAASALGDEPLQAAGQSAQDAASALGQQTTDVRQALADAFDALDRDGYQVLDAAAGEAGVGLATLTERAASAFAEAEQSVERERARVEEERTASEDALGECAASVGEARDAVGAAAEEGVSGWSSEVPAAIEAQATVFAPDIQVVFDGFEAQAAEAADRIQAGVAALVQGALSAAETEAADLEAALLGAAEQSLGPLDQEGQALLGLLQAGVAVGERIDALEGDLQVTPRKVDEIAQLLQALE